VAARATEAAAVSGCVPTDLDERDALERLIDELVAQHGRRSRLEWAALMLARHVDVSKSILQGRPVPVYRLDAVVLRRALRGEPIPDPDSWFRVRIGHLDAIAEAGPLVSPDAR
jgi:hypothetical protein